MPEPDYTGEKRNNGSVRAGGGGGDADRDRGRKGAGEGRLLSVGVFAIFKNM